MVLKDEFGKASIFERCGAKGALADEAVGTVRNGDSGPVTNGPFRGHVAARIEGVRRRLPVDPKGRLEAHAQLGNRTHFKADGARPVFASARFFPPMMEPLNVAALEVHVGRLIRRRKGRFPRKHQRVETHRALGLAGVQLVHHFLQMAGRRAPRVALGAPPEQSRSAQVNQRSVHQGVALRFDLNK